MRNVKRFQKIEIVSNKRVRYTFASPQEVVLGCLLKYSEVLKRPTQNLNQKSFLSWLLILLQFFYVRVMIQRFRVAEGILVENRFAFDNLFDCQFDFFHVQGIGNVRYGKNF